MTDDLIEDWMKNVRGRRPGTLRNPPSMIDLGSSQQRLYEELNFKLERKNGGVIIIPDGIDQPTSTTRYFG